MYIYSRSVNVGLRRRSARIENVKSADIRNCIQTVDMTSLQQATDRFYANEEKGFHGYQPSALLFVEGIGEKSQDCMLETCCFRYLFPVQAIYTSIRKRKGGFNQGWEKDWVGNLNPQKLFEEPYPPTP